MRTGAVLAADIAAQGFRLTGGFYLAEDQHAMRLLDRVASADPLIDLTYGRGIFRGPIFRRIFALNNIHGRPYVSARDLDQSDITPSEFLSYRHGPLLNQLELHEGMILVTCSGMNLGRAIWTRGDMEGLCASHDLIRIEPDPSRAPPGYVYSFLASHFGHVAIRRQIYGGSIKHIEPQHISNLRVPRFDKAFESQVHALVEEAAHLRSASSSTIARVAKRFDQLIEDLDLEYKSPRVSFVAASAIQSRFDAQFHEPVAQNIRAHLASQQHSTIGGWCNRIFLPGIFKRIHIDEPSGGAPYYTGAALFCSDPHPKGILSRRTTLFEQVRLERNTILVQAFGQEGGLMGRSVWVGEHLHGATTTHMLVRLNTNSLNKTAYLFGFLQSQSAYRQIASLPYGGSIPHFDEAGLATVILPLLSATDQLQISREVLAALRQRERALVAERAARALIERAIEAT